MKLINLAKLKNYNYKVALCPCSSAGRAIDL